MATASSILSEDQFLCSICLEVFTDPVTIPCGHNFCKRCITQHWTVNVQNKCPMCADVFNRRPELRVNVFISEMAAQFRQSAVNKASSSSVMHQGDNAGDVLCDVCSETRLKAVKSCLVCLTSYCETHLESHHGTPGMKRHQLMDPVKNLEDRLCKKHDRPLEMFCQTDQVCVCQFCTESNHWRHSFVPLIEEYQHKKTKLENTEAEIQEMIEERQLKMEQIKESVKLSKEEADRETAASVQVFTALSQSVQRGLAQLIHTIEEKEKSTEKQAECFIKELEEEISELMKRSSEVKQLSHTEDQLLFLQGFKFLDRATPTKDWTEVRVHASYEGIVRRAVVQLEETLSEEVKRLCAEVELKGFRRFAVDVTLDSETANPFLILSEDRKQVSHGDRQNVPESPNRFSYSTVLGAQGFCSGRFYYEVQVKDKIDWTVGVATESINRKDSTKNMAKKHLCAICLREGKCQVVASTICISLKSKPEKLGVFVDYEEGLVSFYDVDAADLIYTFTGCNFTERVYPYFNPRHNLNGTNSTPLIICPVTTQ
ncbi:E3 ubiquitin-protein ligase TRIM39-like [Acanthochromis polyacanthus]|uniref:E3 ubiquitin-protein ligase TRIM39-like n=1 Tax=Acanthochromis polyacanthus TaxID=80966 RepID=UPI002233E73A|nr:E3 ubiquitin-protein ligase TRIM39-like [Acanthochromis polyacanthus]XP_051810151.1 E3 ubiquitin-protein ligase TRIM39-like [Acanthochromis polyacanthus]